MPLNEDALLKRGNVGAIARRGRRAEKKSRRECALPRAPFRSRPVGRGQHGSTWMLALGAGPWASGNRRRYNATTTRLYGRPPLSSPHRRAQPGFLRLGAPRWVSSRSVSRPPWPVRWLVVLPALRHNTYRGCGNDVHRRGGYRSRGSPPKDSHTWPRPLRSSHCLRTLLVNSEAIGRELAVADGRSCWYRRSHYCPGSLDHVRIYNRALSATKVKALHQLGTLTLHHPNPTSITAAWGQCELVGVEARQPLLERTVRCFATSDQYVHARWVHGLLAGPAWDQWLRRA